MKQRNAIIETEKYLWNKKKNLTLHMFLSGFINVFRMQIRIPRFAADVFIFNPKMILPVLSKLDEIHIELMHALKNHGVVLN